MVIDLRWRILAAFAERQPARDPARSCEFLELAAGWKRKGVS